MFSPFNSVAPENSDAAFLNLEFYAKELSFTSELLFLLETHYIRIGRPKSTVLIGALQEQMPSPAAIEGTCAVRQPSP